MRRWDILLNSTKRPSHSQNAQNEYYLIPLAGRHADKDSLPNVVNNTERASN
jgi:hypothetical protein